MDIILYPVLSVILTVCNLYGWGLLIYVALSWLEHFNVVNRFHPGIYTVHNWLFRLYEPTLARIREWFGPIAGVDLSPLIIWLGLMLIEGILTRVLLRFF